MKFVSLVCSIETNKKGRFELVPHANVYDRWSGSAFDINSLGKYFRIRSDVVQRLVLELEIDDDCYSKVVIANFSVKKNLVLLSLGTIKKGCEPKMTENSNYIINIKSVANPTPQAIRSELEKVDEVKALFVLVNISYAAVNQAKQPHKIPCKFEQDVAVKVAKILEKNGAAIEVLDESTGAVIFTSSLVPTSSAPKKSAPPVKESSEVDPDYFYVPDSLRHISAAISAMVLQPTFRSTSLLISGPSGYGKTAFAGPLAKVLGMKTAAYDMSLLVDTEDFFGSRQIQNGSTVFEFNEFVTNVEEGGWIIVLDETNRTIPSALNAALGLLDWRGEAIVHGRHIKVGPKTVFIATRNIGNEYSGTHSTDAAFSSRFAFSAVIDSMPIAEEIKLLTKRTGVNQEEATRIVKVANFIREQSDLGVNVSPRNTLEVSGMVAAGVHARCAFQWNVLMKIEDPSVRIQVETIFNRQLGIEYGAAASNLKNIF